MKTIVTLMAVAATLFAISSCENCTECTKYPGKPVKLCKRDFGSTDSYNDAYRATIIDGYKCD